MRTTLAQALVWLQQPSGRTVEDNRPELVRLANRIRAEIYAIYDKIQWANDEEEMLQVQEFCRMAEGRFRGITVPSHIENIEQAFYNGRTIKIYSRWREGRTEAQFTSNFELREMNATSPLQLDPLECGEWTTLLFMAEEEADKNKELAIDLTSLTDGETTRHVPLPAGGWATLDNVREVEAIRLPANLQGGVRVGQKLSDGSVRELARYGPKDYSPSYRRYQLIGSSPNCDEFIRVIGTRRYAEVWFDDDMVEINNPRAWEEGANYFRYIDQGTDADLLQKAEYHRQRLYEMLLGEKARANGKNRADKFATTPVRRSRLGGSRRWR